MNDYYESLRAYGKYFKVFQHWLFYLTNKNEIIAVDIKKTMAENSLVHQLVAKDAFDFDLSSSRL